MDSLFGGVMVIMAGNNTDVAAAAAELRLRLQVKEYMRRTSTSAQLEGYVFDGLAMD